MSNIIHTEEVRNGAMARYPYKDGYVQPTKEGFVFNGWIFNGVLHTPQEYESEENNPFGPITEDNVSISADWLEVMVYCSSNKSSIGYLGDTMVVSYYAEANERITTNDVTLTIEGEYATDFFTIVSDVVSGDHRECTIQVDINRENTGRNLIIKANYAGVESESIVVYQESPYEMVIPDSDYIVFSYEWADGKDLDSLTVIHVEDDNGNRLSKSFTNQPVGWRFSFNDYTGGFKREVLSNNNLVCLQHGGDNRISGAEGALICMTNIANTGEISNLNKIYVEIYANWFGIRDSGDMNINCRGYKTKEGHTTDLNSDIIKVEHIVPGDVNYYTFEPNTENCEVSWDGFSDSFNIKAQGPQNAYFDNGYVECIGNFYSHVCTLTYDVAHNIKTYVPRTEDNGIARRIDDIRFRNSNNDNYSTFTIGSEGGTLEVNECYITYAWNNLNSYLFSNNKDYIRILFRVNRNEGFYYNNNDIRDIITLSQYNRLTNEEKNNYTLVIPEKKIYKQDINNEVTYSREDIFLFEELKITKNTNGKFNIKVIADNVSSNFPRNITLYLMKYTDDCQHPGVSVSVQINQESV